MAAPKTCRGQKAPPKQQLQPKQNQMASRRASQALWPKVPKGAGVSSLEPSSTSIEVRLGVGTGTAQAQLVSGHPAKAARFSWPACQSSRRCASSQQWPCRSAASHMDLKQQHTAMNAPSSGLMSGQQSRTQCGMVTTSSSTASRDATVVLSWRSSVSSVAGR